MRLVSPHVPSQPEGSLQDAALTAARWVAGARIALEVLAFGAALVLARLIPPAEFGRAVIAITVATVVPSLIGAMFGTPLVRLPETHRRHHEAAAWLALVTAVAIAVLVASTAVPLGRLILDEDAGRLLQLATPALLLSGLAVVPQAMLQRRLDFRQLSRIDVISALVGTAATLALAIAGLDAEALVLGTVIAGAVATALAVAAVWPPLPRWRRAEMREIVRVGVPAGVGSALNLSYRNLDYVIIGARLGAASLGIYWRAFQLGAEYQRKISGVMQRVAFPLYARSRDIDHLRRIRRRIVRTHAAVIFPLLALLIVGAPELVPLLFGDAWEEAVVPTQILAVAGMVAAVVTGMGPVMLALGKTQRLMLLGFANVTVYALIIFLTAPYGLTAVCIGATGAALIVMLTNHHVLLTRGAGIPLRELAQDAGPAFVASAAVVAAGFPLRSSLLAAGVPDVLMLGLLAIMGLPLNALVLRAVSRPTWMDLRLLAKRVFERRRAAASSTAAPPIEVRAASGGLADR